MIEPYFENDFASLYLGDAREVLSTFAPESVDMVATDPPYGAGWRSNTRKERFDSIAGDATVGEAKNLLDEVAPEIVRVTRRARHIYTFGLSLGHPLLVVKAELVWDKGRIGSGDLYQAWGPSHEPIYFHARAADKTNAERRSGSLAARLRRGSVIRVRRLSANQVKRHPTEKPVELMRQLIESSSNFGELVLDPFAGVGSTLVAAALEGRRSIGVELEERYAEIAAERLIAVSDLLEGVVAA